MSKVRMKKELNERGKVEKGLDKKGEDENQ